MALPVPDAVRVHSLKAERAKTRGDMLTRAEERMKAMERDLSREDGEILLDMREKFVESMSFGFRPEVMDILDNEYAHQRQIESIKDMLNQAVCARMYGIGNSIYYGRLRKGDVTSFFEVAMRLGTAHTKMYIIMLSLLQIASSPNARQLLAKAIATSVLGKVAAIRLGLPRESASKVELAGLFLEIGRIIALIYDEKEQKHRLPPDFPDRFNVFIGLKVIDRFHLPPYLSEVLLEDTIAFDEESFAVSTVVRMAHLLVSSSFSSRGLLSLKVPLPGANAFASSQYGAVIREWFGALGLDKYIEIVEAPTETQRKLLPEPADTI